MREGESKGGREGREKGREGERKASLMKTHSLLRNVGELDPSILHTPTNMVRAG